MKFSIDRGQGHFTYCYIFLFVGELFEMLCMFVLDLRLKNIPL
jgi:hypothetical protein